MLQKFHGWFWFVGLLLFVGCPGPHPQSNVGKVVHVSDGDTFILQPEQGEKIKVRVAYIDCPELNQAYGLEAKAFTLEWAKGKEVAVEVLDTDRYGRVIGWVTAGEETLNHLLVEEGYAWHFTRYTSDFRLARMERKAQKAKLGLWSEKNPIPPWEFRNR
ncbi:MAG: thermonuclease family protein [Cyclobacteriaceae bacterium]